MDRVSGSNGSLIANIGQAALPSDCQACPLRVGCNIRGTVRQCAAIPLVLDDIQPGTQEALEWEECLDGFDHRMVGAFKSVNLPQAIPRIGFQSAAGNATRGISWVAVELEEALRDNGKRVLARADIVRDRLDPDIHIVLVMAGKDAAMSSLGNARSELIASIADAGYDLVLAPLFSVWDGHSPFHNRTQIVYSDRFASDLAAADIPTIPGAAWYPGTDIYDLAEAVNANPSIRVMWLDWQTIPCGQAAWERALREFDEFAALVPGVSFIINGVGEVRRADLWKRGSVLAVISSQEFIGSVRKYGGGIDGALAARDAIRAFIAEPQLAAARSSRAR